MTWDNLITVESQPIAIWQIHRAGSSHLLRSGEMHLVWRKTKPQSLQEQPGFRHTPHWWKPDAGSKGNHPL
jgi:hypothetical protein